MFLRDVEPINSDLDFLMRESLFEGYGFVRERMLWPVYPTGFAGLVRIVLGQQVSTHVAEVMWQKFSAAAPSVSPGWVLQQDFDDLRALGLSRQKTRYIQSLAEAVEGGVFDVEALEAMSDEAVVKAVTAQLGFGLWSAQMYLIFSLCRPNILPKSDLGVDKALVEVFGLKDMPDYAEALHITKAWDGRLTAFSMLLWQVYMHHRDQGGL